MDGISKRVSWAGAEAEQQMVAHTALRSHRHARTRAPFPARVANFKVFNIC